MCDKCWTIYSILNLFHEENKKSLHVPQNLWLPQHQTSNCPKNFLCSFTCKNLLYRFTAICCSLCYLTVEMLLVRVHKFLLWHRVSQDPCSVLDNITYSISVINMIKFNINILNSKGMNSMQIHEIDKPATDNSVPTRTYALLHIKYHVLF